MVRTSDAAILVLAAALSTGAFAVTVAPVGTPGFNDGTAKGRGSDSARQLAALNCGIGMEAV